ncbi:MAG TPA: LPS assembly protein LptD [Vitreimonas sp.]|uniref:LPS-assembly protein LptD n=1 Tax=Vitreimonas sp. TaxID=3069702 RepID=UPI002D254604|nr:LPS assembly protein LptD [Vitreimonas sp.]HYD89507.1 LPS assembly protein LptD [Vitreimonas sp.]
MSRSGEMAGRSAERTPSGWAALAAALAVSVSSTALAQTQAPSAPAAPTEQSENVLLEADELIDDQEARTITAQGDVQVRYQGRTMRSDRLVYDLNTGSIRASGNVQIALEDGSVTYAEEIEADEAMNVGAARELRARLGDSSTLAARQALRHGEGQSELRNVIYTSCPICESGDRPPTWSLRARRAVQNRDTRTISYQGAVLEVVGVPVLYIPYIAHPDPTIERASGFLPPDIGRNRRLGTFYEQPYYWAISPSQDLTASLRLHGNVNPLIGLDYRKRFWSGEMSLETTFTEEQLFDDDGDTFGDEVFRWSAFGEGRFEVNDYWDWGFGLERAYDDQYLRRYDIDGAGERRGPYVGQELRLLSQLFAIGQSENSYSSIAAISFQGLRTQDTSDLLPLILPFAETDYVLREPVLDGQVRLQANSAVLSRDDNPLTAGTFEGSTGRVSVSASWRRDMIFGPGMVFSPFAQARGDVYQIETSEDEYETFNRGLGLAGAEVSWPFMRPGERFDLIVEPVVMAAIATDDPLAPLGVNEDSLAFELDDSNLFRPNAAPNYDLWEPGERVSAGVRTTARAHTGESASLLFGRRWRDEQAPGFTPQNNLDGENTDWVAAGQVDLGRNFGAEARVRLEDETLDIQRVDLGVRGAVGRFTGYARYYRVDEALQFEPTDPNEELTTSLGVDLARGWRMQASLTRDLDSDINLRQDIRAIYEDDCTFLEISYTRRETQLGALGPDEGLQIRIGLRSLGVFGGS